MDKNIFYNGQRLINTKDINGNTPEIFIVDGNRSDGKTTWFSKKLVNDFKKHGKKFMLIKRYKNQLKNSEKKFFKLIGEHWFKHDILTAESREQGSYYELFLNKKPCGYVCDLNSAYKLKDMSQFFSDTDQMFLDEFQALEYVPEEFNKFFTLHFSVARGFGSVSRYVPVYMCCNHISSINPYYKALKCGAAVDSIEKGFYKGDGFVIERDFNTKVMELQKQSAFNRAFSGTDIYNHSVLNESLTDNFSFVERVKTSKFQYICNIIVDGEYISLVRVLDVKGVHYYFSEKVNMNCKSNFTIFSNDHSIDTLLLPRNIDFLNALKSQFDHGFIRFSTLDVKAKAFEFLSIMI